MSVSGVWPVEAARNAKWAKLDKSRRGEALGDVVWHAHHNHAHNAEKIRRAALFWPLLNFVAYFADIDAFHFIGFPRSTLFLLIECLLGMTWIYYTFTHWRLQRNMSAEAVMLVFFPDWLKKIYDARKKKTKSGEKKSLPKAVEVAPTPDKTAGKSCFQPVHVDAWGGSLQQKGAFGLGGGGGGGGGGGEFGGGLPWGDVAGGGGAASPWRAGQTFVSSPGYGAFREKKTVEIARLWATQPEATTLPTIYQ